jgi:hypothetical protein
VRRWARCGGPHARWPSRRGAVPTHAVGAAAPPQPPPRLVHLRRGGRHPFRAVHGEEAVSEGVASSRGGWVRGGALEAAGASPGRAAATSSSLTGCLLLLSRAHAEANRPAVCSKRCATRLEHRSFCSRAPVSLLSADASFADANRRGCWRQSQPRTTIRKSPAPITLPPGGLCREVLAASHQPLSRGIPGNSNCLLHRPDMATSSWSSISPYTPPLHLPTIEIEPW